MRYLSIFTIILSVSLVFANNAADAKAADEPSNPWTIKNGLENNIDEDQKEIILQLAFDNKETRGGHLRKDYNKFLHNFRRDLENEFGVRFWCLLATEYQFLTSGSEYCGMQMGFYMTDDDVVVLCKQTDSTCSI